MEDLLRAKKAGIARRWAEVALEVYPEQTRRFLAGQKDRFANPVGATLATELPALLDGLLDSAAPDALAAHLDPLIQVRCVQDLSPSQAVGFVLRLKEVVREALAERADDDALRPFDARVDGLLLLAFDRFAAFRERIYRIRVREVKNRVSTLAKMHDISFGDLDPAPPPAGDEAPKA